MAHTAYPTLSNALTLACRGESIATVERCGIVNPNTPREYSSAGWGIAILPRRAGVVTDTPAAVGVRSVIARDIARACP